MWSGLRIVSGLSASLRFSLEKRNNISGRDRSLDIVADGPSSNDKKRGGFHVDVHPGISLEIPGLDRQRLAVEFGLPIRLTDGMPLRSNPAVAALLDLLRLMLPRAEDDPEPALPWRALIEAWRSPYFDWSALPEEGASESIGITAEGAYGLDMAARWGRVVGGLSQWEEVLSDLVAMQHEPQGDEERDAPAHLPRGAAAGDRPGGGAGFPSPTPNS